MRIAVVFLAALAPSVASGSLILTGVGDPDGGSGDIIELFATAAIADLSIYGIATANNGAAVPGTPEFSLSGSATAGQFLYATTNQGNFTSFVGFAADFVSGTIGINGNDSVYLYQSGGITDVFGYVPNIDFTGLDGDYADGWAYREDATTASGNATTTFTDWTGGTDLLGSSSSSTNAASPTPMPIGSFAVPEASEALVALLGSSGLLLGCRRRKRTV